MNALNLWLKIAQSKISVTWSLSVTFLGGTKHMFLGKFKVVILVFVWNWAEKFSMHVHSNFELYLMSLIQTQYGGHKEIISAFLTEKYSSSFFNFHIRWISKEIRLKSDTFCVVNLFKSRWKMPEIPSTHSKSFCRWPTLEQKSTVLIF